MQVAIEDDIEASIIITEREKYLEKNLDMKKGYTYPGNGPNEVISSPKVFVLMEYLRGR